MALTANSFLKVTPVIYDAGEGDTPTSISRAFSDRIEDPETVEVFYNGQLIENSTDNPTGKYYYTAVITLTPLTVSLSLPTPPVDTSTAVFTILPNPAYTGIGYGSGTSADTLSVQDSVVISYYYVIYT